MEVHLIGHQLASVMRCKTEQCSCPQTKNACWQLWKPFLRTPLVTYQTSNSANSCRWDAVPYSEEAPKPPKLHQHELQSSHAPSDMARVSLHC